MIVAVEKYDPLLQRGNSTFITEKLLFLIMTTTMVVGRGAIEGLMASASARMKEAMACRTTTQELAIISHAVLNDLSALKSTIELLRVSLGKEIDEQKRASLQKEIEKSEKFYRTMKVELRMATVRFHEAKEKERKRKRLNLLGSGSSSSSQEGEQELHKAIRKTESFLRTRDLLVSQIEKTKIALSALNDSAEKLTDIDKNTDTYTGIIRLGKKTMNSFLSTKAYDGIKIFLALFVYIMDVSDLNVRFSTEVQDTHAVHRTCPAQYQMLDA
eukprot:jgi/Bigna1/87471/estExt_fgenesh1_pg.C_200206